MRILDGILAGHCARINRAEFKKEISDMEAFDITNVAEYLYAQTDQEVWDVEHDFPCLAPPFPQFWMEFARPSKLVSELTGIQDCKDTLPYRTALWFQYHDRNALAQAVANPKREAAGKLMMDQMAIELARQPELMREIRELKAAGVNFANPADPGWRRMSPAAHQLVSQLYQCQAFTMPPETATQALEQLERDGIRWIMKCVFFMQAQRHGPVMGPLGEQTLQIKDNGEARPGGATTGFDNRVMPREAWLRADGGGGLSTLWFSGLLAISFLHCKNVTVAREAPPPAALAKRQRERGDEPRVLFKTLEITPMKKVLEHAQAEHSTSLQRALHICRGHFATYTERPLFGKYQGRFWIPQHLRGRLDKGLVHKEYKINPPTEKP